MVCVHISTIIVQEGISFEDVQAFTELVEKTYQMLRWHSVCIWQQELPSPLVYYTYTLSLSLSLSAFFPSPSTLSLAFFYHLWIITYYAHSLSAFSPGCTLNLSFCLLPSPLALFPFVFFFFHHSWYTSAFPPSLLLIYYTHTYFSLLFCMCACGWYFFLLT